MYCFLIAVAVSIGSKTKVFLLLGRPPVMHSLCEASSAHSVTARCRELPGATRSPLARPRASLLTEETGVYALMKFLRFRRRVLKLEVSGEQRVPAGD